MNRAKQIRHGSVALALVLALGTAGCAASARSSGRSIGPDFYAGTWSGTFVASNFDGDVDLDLAFADGEWSGTMVMGAMGDRLDGAITNFEFEENACSFMTYIQGGDLIFKGTVAEAKMTGTFEVFVEGEHADGGTFSLTRQ